MLNIITNLCNNCERCITSCVGNAIKYDISELGKHNFSIDTSICLNCQECLVTKNCVGLYDSSAIIDEGNNSYIISKTDNEGLCTKISRQFLTFYSDSFVIGVINDNNDIKYAITSDINYINNFSNSKYVRAKLSDDVLNSIYESLSNSSYVLFIGLPCDVITVYKYLNDKDANTSKFYTISFLCNNAPQETAFNKYIEYIRNENDIEDVDEVTNIEFSSNNTIISFKSGTTIEDDKYMKLFDIGVLSSTNACLACNIKYPNVSSDIIIGNNAVDSSSTSNIISVLTDRGRLLLNALEIDITKGTKIDKDYIISQQTISSVTTPAKNMLLNLYSYTNADDTGIFNKLIKLTHPKIGIIGFLNDKKIGSKLSLLGLYNECYNISQDTVFLGTNSALIKVLPYDLIDIKHHPTTNEECDNIIIGPHDLWNSMIPIPSDSSYDGLIYAESYMNSNKISYSTSGPDCSANFRLDINNNNPLDSSVIVNLSAISVKETFTKDILNENNITSYHAIDPIFFMARNEWLEYMNNIQSTMNIDSSADVFAYSINNIYSEEVFYIANKIGNADCYTKKIYPHSVERITSEIANYDAYNLINQINTSNITVTDDYYTFCMGLILNKPILFIKYNTIEDNKVLNLINKINLPDLTLNINTSDSDIIAKTNIAKSIDYNTANKTIKTWIYESKTWLENNLII